MADVLQYGNVIYFCTCGSKKSICHLYFCRHCLKLRCGECVSHEVDSHYCPNCLENMPSPEARMKKNRCVNCFDCPSCTHTLSTRATSMQIPTSEDPTKTVPKKVYYLACGFCRWTSRDVGLKDQSVASGGWQEQENPHTKRINSLLEFYRALAQKEKLEKEKKKMNKRRGHFHFSDKYGITAALVRKRAGMSPLSSQLALKEEDQKPIQIEEAVATTDVGEELSEDYFTKPPNIFAVTTINQRLANPAFQPSSTKDLYPIHKHQLVKRSQRCKECDHNLYKPEYNPSSIKFKIQLAAFYHIPNVRLLSKPSLKVNEESVVTLTLTNPSQYVMHVTLLPPTDDEDQPQTEIVLPSDELTLAAHDDAADFDDLSEGNVYKDDPNVVAFRKANKLGVYVKIKPGTSLDELSVRFRVKYDHVNTVLQATGEQKEPQVAWMETELEMWIGGVESEKGDGDKL